MFTLRNGVLMSVRRNGEADMRNAVGLMGTALTDDQVHELSRMALTVLAISILIVSPSTAMAKVA